MHLRARRQGVVRHHQIKVLKIARIQGGTQEVKAFVARRATDQAKANAALNGGLKDTVWQVRDTVGQGGDIGQTGIAVQLGKRLGYGEGGVRILDAPLCHAGARR